MEKNYTERLEQLVGRDAGMTVPEGFFEVRFKEIQDSLPPYPEAPVAERLSPWHRIRPYVYMAAMFAGIWLMMQVFHRVSSPERLSLDNIPEQIALAVNSADADHDFSIMAAAPADDYELESEVADSYGDISSFEKDFGYELQPQYADMSVE